MKAYVAKAHAGKTGEALAGALAADQGFFDTLSDAKADKPAVAAAVVAVKAHCPTRGDSLRPKRSSRAR